MRPKVFVTRPLPESSMELLRTECDVRFHPDDAPMSPDQLIDSCRDAEGLLVINNRVNEELLRQLPRLRAVSTPSVGYDNIDVAACTRRRIPVTNIVGALEETTADQAFALLLAVARRTVEADRYVRAGHWKSWQWGLLHGANVHHKTLGLIGFGHIGQAVARRAKGFSMRILYHSRNRVKPELESEFQALYVDRETLFRESDFISLHVPLTPQTHHLIQKKDFDMMRPTAFLINTARGSVVDEEAMVEALKAGRIAGAGLDVFEYEPRVHPEMVKMDHLVLAPHIGSATTETRTQMALTAAQNLLDAMAGRRPPNIINPAIYL